MQGHTRGAGQRSADSVGVVRVGQSGCLPSRIIGPAGAACFRLPAAAEEGTEGGCGPSRFVWRARAPFFLKTPFSRRRKLLVSQKKRVEGRGKGEQTTEEEEKKGGSYIRLVALRVRVCASRRAACARRLSLLLAHSGGRQVIIIIIIINH